MKKKISYLNGYLKGFELLNSLVNDGKTYFSEVLPKENNIQDTLSKYYNKKNWKFNIVDTESTQWENLLKEELKYYFSQIITDVYCTFNLKGLRSSDLYDTRETKEKISQVDKYYENNIEMVVSEFIFLVRGIVKESEFIKVYVDWHTDKYEGFYECYANDYIFDLGEQYLYLHFGGSD